MLDMPSNLLAHHLKVMRQVGLLTSHRSQGDGRRLYLHLADHTLDLQSATPLAAPLRVVFVCTANSAGPTSGVESGSTVNRQSQP